MEIGAIQTFRQYALLKSNLSDGYQNKFMQLKARIQTALMPDLSKDCFVSFNAARKSIYTKTDPAMQSIETLKLRGGKIPKRVEELAIEYAKDEMLKNLTLAEVHKIAYSDLKKCKTLDEAKEMFPEFEAVLPADKPAARKGSVLYGIQQGEVIVDSCSKDTDDASLKLLQYIWADLYSLANVSRFVRYTGKYYSTHEMAPAIKSLKIPLLDYEYAQAAKFEKGHHKNG